jgi:signal transduction histidine kinase
MIHELLDASRLQAGRLEVNRRAVPLKQFLEGALHKVTPSLSQRGDDLVVQLPRSDSEVLIDPGRIEQVLHNLVDNAARYSASGSSIRIGATLEHDLAVVTVEDSGDGIPAHETARIFDPFFRGENARRRGAHGTGLGLAICRGIIDSHGGRLWVDSSPGKGSTFSFALSLVDGGDAESPASEEAMISPDRESM